MSEKKIRKLFVNRSLPVEVAELINWCLMNMKWKSLSFSMITVSLDRNAGLRRWVERHSSNLSY